MTKVFKITPSNILEEVKEGAEIIKKGGTVAFPTETVYGLGANALVAGAVEKIFAAKGRPSDNPLIVHIAELASIYPLVTDFPEKAKLLARKFWPGPLTMVLPAAPGIPNAVTAGLKTVGIRMPNHPVALALISAAGVPIAAPSANTSGLPSPTSADHVILDLDGKIDAIINGGECQVGVESTVVDLTTSIPVILRPGGVTREMLEAVVGAVTIDKALTAADHPRAPGMKYKHYSPKGEVYLVNGHGCKLADKLNLLLLENREKKLRTALLITEETAKFIKQQPQFLYSFKDVLAAAQNLYAALRLCDENKIDVIYCETFSQNGMGLAVMNRMSKAAAGRDI